MRNSIVLAVVLTMYADLASAAVVRFQQPLDNGTTVTVDNASGWSQGVVGNLVVAADRSTRDGCPYSYATKGLFKTGDRIFVNQNYLAWFDFTIGDGVSFPPPYANNWPRSGELAGFWSLNPSTQLFRYYRQAPGGCWNWPANELITGSASATGGTFWWDAYSPTFEHALIVRRTDGGSPDLFMAFNYVQGTAGSAFTRAVDGTEDGAGVHYKQTAKLTTNMGATDIKDGNDSPNSLQYINARQEYICRTNDILSIFDFSPSVNATITNAFQGWWTAYAQDEDGTACDAGGAGEQWPSASQITLQPLYAQSNQIVRDAESGLAYAPHAFVQLQIDSACPADDSNRTLFVDGGLPGVQLGDFMRWGADPTIAASKPRWQLLNLGAPGTGSGTSGDPEMLRMRSMWFANERGDGSVGGGIGKGGPGEEVLLIAGRWYRMYVSMQTNF
jgi:hypothetical protein